MNKDAVSLKAVDDKKLQHKLLNKGYQYDDKVPLSELTPSQLLRLKDAKKIKLDKDIKKLLKDLVKIGDNHLKPLGKSTKRLKPISELKDSDLQDLPKNIDIKNALKELQDSKIDLSKLDKVSKPHSEAIRSLPWINPNNGKVPKTYLKDQDVKLSSLPAKMAAKLSKDGLINLSPNTQNALNHLKSINKPRPINNDTLSDIANAANKNLNKIVHKAINKLTKGSPDIEKAINKSLSNKKLPSNIVKSIANNHYRPIIDALENQSSDDVKISELPFEIQDSLESQGLAMLPKIDGLTDDDKEIVLRKQDIVDNSESITKPELDKINPYSNDVLLEALPDEVIDDLYKNGIVDEHKNIIGRPSLSEYLATIPEEIDNVDKIINRIKGDVDEDLVHALSSLPKQHNKLNQLPAQALKALEEDGVISLPQNYNDTKFCPPENKPKDIKIRHRSKNSSRKRTESPSSVQNNIPIDNLLKN